MHVNGRHWNTCKLMFARTPIREPVQCRTRTRVYVNAALHGSALTWTTWGGHWICLTYFYRLGNLCAKNCQIWWRVDEVLTKTVWVIIGTPCISSLSLVIAGPSISGSTSQSWSLPSFSLLQPVLWWKNPESKVVLVSWILIKCCYCHRHGRHSVLVS